MRVLVIISDSLRKDVFNEKLGDLFSKFHVFENYHVSGTCTPPCITSLLTGRFPHSHGRINYTKKPNKFKTVAEYMQEKFRTVGLFSTDTPSYQELGFSLGFDTWISNSETRKKPEVQDLEKLGKCKEEIVKDNSFVVLHSFLVHDWVHDFHDCKGKRIRERMPKEKSQFIERYERRTECFRDRIVNLFEFMKGEKVYDDTLIVFCADHGEAFLEDGWSAQHGSLVRPIKEVVNPPLAIKLPNQQGGVRVNGLVRDIDVAPTILEYYAIKAEGMDGVSIRPVMDGTKELNLVSLNFGDYSYPSCNNWKAVYTKDFSVIFEEKFFTPKDGLEDFQ